MNRLPSIVPPHTHDEYGTAIVGSGIAAPGEPNPQNGGPQGDTGPIGPEGPKAVIAVAALPSNPYTGYVEGDLVYLTTDKKVYRLVDDTAAGTTGWSRAVDGQDITAGTFTADQIYTGTLSAAVLLSGTIRTAEYPNDRVEMDTVGLRAYDGVNPVLIVPTDGTSEVFINAAVQAKSLEVTGNAEFRGTANQFLPGSISTLGNNISNPGTKPLFTADLQTLTTTTAALKGLAYDSAGGAGGATAVWWTVGTSPNNPTLYEILASDGTTNRSKNLTSELEGGIGTATGGGVCVLGSYVYVMWRKVGTSNYRVSRYLKSTLAHDANYDSVSLPIASPRYPSIGSDGTDIYIADIAATTGYVSWNKYDATMTKVGSTIATGVAPGGASMTGGDIFVGNGDFGAWRLLISGWSSTSTKVFAFDSTGTRQSSDDFTRGGGDPDGIGYNGTYFYTLKSGFGVLNKYAKKSVVAGTYWCAYAWYDSAGTTHETMVSPRKSLSVTERRFLTVTTPVEPGAGGAEDPNGRRIYLLQQVAEPTTGNMKLQATTSDETSVFDAYDGSGGADASSNGFASLGGSPAEIKSSGGEWYLKGDGTSLVGQGWAPGAYPLGWSPTQAHSTALSLAAVSGGNGGARAIPILVPAPMIARNYFLWATDTASARQCEVRLYRDVGAANLQFVTGTDATFSFTPTVAARRNAQMSGTPVTLSPGVYWLVIRNTSTTQTFGIGYTAATDGTDPTMNVGSAVAALGSTIDLTAWTESSAVIGIFVSGVVWNGDVDWGVV